MDFESLTIAEQDALEGYQREAWYAWRKGDTEKAAAILATYESAPADEAPAPADDVVEDAPVEVADGAPADIETADAKPRRARKAS